MLTIRPLLVICCNQEVARRRISPEPSKGYSVLFGEGVAPWKNIFAAAEKTRGIEYYRIEQEGTAYPPMETAVRSISAIVAQ